MMMMVFMVLWWNILINANDQSDRREFSLLCRSWSASSKERSLFGLTFHGSCLTSNGPKRRRDGFLMIYTLHWVSVSAQSDRLLTPAGRCKLVYVKTRDKSGRHFVAGIPGRGTCSSWREDRAASRPICTGYVPCFIFILIIGPWSVRALACILVLLLWLFQNL